MIETIMALVGSPILGSAIGFVGSWLKDREHRKHQESVFLHQQAMAEITAKNRREELALQSEIEDTKSRGQAFDTSQKYGNINSGNTIIDGIKTLVRPIITTYLLVIITILGFKLNTLLGGLEIFTPEEMLSLYREVIMTLLALTSLSISWWFGSRNALSNHKILQ